MPDSSQSESPEAAMRERFIRDIAEHEMTVLHDDGLYRHLRFQRVGASFYWFDIVTWPGVLTISGDCGAFMFSRTRDMLEFFEPRPGGARGGFEDARWGINPDYWSEKLRAPQGSRAVEVYSAEAARRRIDEWAADIAADMEDDYLEFDEEGPAGGRAGFEFWRELHSELFYVEMEDEHAVREFLRDLEIGTVRCEDWWEWSMWEYDWQFLWCCWAIVWGIERYRAATREAVPA